MDLRSLRKLRTGASSMIAFVELQVHCCMPHSGAGKPWSYRRSLLASHKRQPPAFDPERSHSHDRWFSLGDLSKPSGNPDRGTNCCRGKAGRASEIWGRAHHDVSTSRREKKRDETGVRYDSVAIGVGWPGNEGWNVLRGTWHRIRNRDLYIGSQAPHSTPLQMYTKRVYRSNRSYIIKI